MKRFAAGLVALMVFTSSAYAGERPDSTDPVAPSRAVAEAWKQEGQRSSSPTLRALFVSYGAAQGLDLATTIKARHSGAVEANPALQGNYATAAAMKVALGAVTIAAARSMEKKSKLAAILTMVGANAATVAVAAHNMRVARAASQPRR